MLTYKLKCEDQTSVVYEYFPEAKDDSGLIEYDKETGEYKIIWLADNDKNRRYVLKMAAKMRQFTANNDFIPGGTIFWG